VMQPGLGYVGHLLTSDRRHGDVEQLPDLISGHRKLFRQFLGCGFSADLERHLLSGANEQIYLLDHSGPNN
jgi:hypothetical protein